MKRVQALAGLVVALGVFGAANARAANITINDALASEQIVISAADFDVVGFTAGGVSFGNTGTNTFDEAAGPIAFSGAWRFNPPVDPNALTHQTIHFLEADGTLSDILDYTILVSGTTANIKGTFWSDVEGGGTVPNLPPATGTFNEANGPFTFFFNNLTGSAISDVDPVTPLPSAVWGGLALLGGLGLMPLKGRRMQQA